MKGFDSVVVKFGSTDGVSRATDLQHTAWANHHIRADYSPQVRHPPSARTSLVLHRSLKSPVPEHMGRSRSDLSTR